jgi:DNA-binding MarR family transcriptional regulator
VIALVTGLSRLEARLVQDFERTAHRPLGLTWAGFRILNALWVYGELPQREIGRVAGSSRASISSALTTLETRELVVRQRTADDRRQFIVTLTPLGLDTLHKAIIKQTERERAWTAALDGGELVQLLGLLQRLVDQETPPAQ